MNKLLYAGFLRLLTRKSLWISCAVTFLLETIAIIENYSYAKGHAELMPSLDSIFFIFTLGVMFLVPVVAAFLLGPEYGDGAMRNKLATGARRRDVYLSNLCISSLAAVMICASGAIAGVVFGVPLLGAFTVGAVKAAAMIACAFFIAVSVAAISTVIMMLIGNDAISSVAVIVAAILIFAVGFYVHNRLSAPEMTNAYVMVVNGEVLEPQPIPNRDYIAPGTLRTALEFVDTALPGGQLMKLVMESAEHPALMMACSAALFVLAAAIGTILFKRKDLR